ncbi:MAG: type II toxin-antitoxin system PemK/MazF family toxin [Eubacteriaceae bacterium]|nr:type II toxin-antitoxin system PemK/MazF family toxin [Eubacteriaceae bacterium]
MNLTKINDMTKEEIIAYIDSKDVEVHFNLNQFDTYYDNKVLSYSKLSKNKNININELKNYAYEINDTSERVEWAYKKQLIEDSAITKINTKPKRGEIWTCQLGKNIGSEEHKTRPVIIIQNNTGNEKSPTTIIVPISNRPKKIAVHIELMQSDYTFVDGIVGDIKGTILCEQIKVVSKARLGKHIATLTNDFMDNILTSKLKMSIGL